MLATDWKVLGKSSYPPAQSLPSAQFGYKREIQLAKFATNREIGTHSKGAHDFPQRLELVIFRRVDFSPHDMPGGLKSTLRVADNFAN